MQRLACFRMIPCFLGGSLAKIAYLSEVDYKRPRHYSHCCAPDEDAESVAQVSLILNGRSRILS